MRRKQQIFIAGLAVVAAAFFAAILAGGSRANAECAGRRPVNLVVIIRQDKVSPGKVEGQLCDTMTFKNLDTVTREIAFGPHEDHVPYDGVAERVLNKNQSFTITFNQAGTYHWHDHLHDEVEGYFTVTK